MPQIEQQRAAGQPVGPVLATGVRFLSPLLEQAMSYWLRIKGDAPYPRRAALAPEEIVALWPFVVIVDVVDGGADYCVRFFGQALVDTYGEQTGRYLSNSPAPPQVRERSKLLFDYSLQHEVPAYAYWPVTASERRPFVDVETLCLPLSSDGTKLDKLMSLNVNSRRA